MDDRKPTSIGAQVRELIASSSGLPSSAAQLGGTDPAQAVARARVMFGCYRRDDAADPETYAAAVSAVLAQYSPEIVMRVTDPRTGIPSRLNWLPTVKEVREACDDLEQREKRMIERAEQERQQLEARKLEAARPRPTLAELQAKYGPNWGLQSLEPERDEQRARRLERLQRATHVTFERECEAAGMPKDSFISPTLHRLIHKGE